jgi:hypothetical protein
MSVQFEGESKLPPRVGVSSQVPFLVRLVMKTGVVSTEASANSILIGIAVLAIVGAMYVFMDSNKPAPTPNPSDYAVWPHT